MLTVTRKYHYSTQRFWVTLWFVVLFFALIFKSDGVWAQGRFSITGKVTGENGEPLPSATVFLGSSQKITITDDKGMYNLAGLDAGTFQLSATMIGYAAFTQTVNITQQAVNIDIKLKIKPNVLPEVNIGGPSQWERDYQTFRMTFLGTTGNALSCQIMNPRVLNFTHKKDLLLADADEMLILENKKLGYRIRYLLKDFQYDRVRRIVLYTGETNFEELTGTNKEKRAWKKNRKLAYQGSMMHFLRSAYQNTALKEGFIINEVLSKQTKFPGIMPVKILVLDTRPVMLDSLTTHLDGAFIALKFKTFFVAYNPKEAAKINKVQSDKPVKLEITFNRDKATIIELHQPQVVIDSKGSYTNYRSFFIEGLIGDRRVGDQLPFEYYPG